MKILFSLLLMTMFGADAPQRLTDEQITALADYFGFGEMEIYKLEDDIANLSLADLDGDGQRDIVVFNPRKSRIDVLAHVGAAVAPESQPNEPMNRGALRLQSVPTSTRVTDLEVADVTGDGHADLIYFGEPRELTVVPGGPDGFAPAQTQRASDGRPRRGSMAIGDFNHDGRTDVALIGDERLLLFLQRPEGGLGSPEKLAHNIQSPELVQAADVDGDGRDDLVISCTDSEYALLLMPQGQDGRLGGLRRVRQVEMRSVTVAARADEADDIFVIERATGRLKRLRWSADAGAGADWPQVSHAWPARSDARRRPLAIGDLTGDGRPDLLFADPKAAQFYLFENSPVGVRAGRAFPGLLEASDVAIADMDGDGALEALVVSPKENLLGRADWESDRLSFPRPLKTGGTPVLVAVGADGEVARVERDAERECAIVISRGETEAARIAIGKLDDDPARLMFVDVDQDGRDDLVLLSDYEKPIVALRGADGWARLDDAGARAELIRDARSAGVAAADVTGNGKAELLIAHRNLIRAVRIENGEWTAVEQINAENPEAELIALTAVDSDSVMRVVAYDRAGKNLLVAQRLSDGGLERKAPQPVGDFSSPRMAAFGAGEDATVVIADERRLLLLSPNQKPATLIEQDSWETKTKDAMLFDSVVGDVNHDGVRDVVLIDGRKASLEILTTAPGGDLVRALTFQVFQGKRFSSAPTSYGEPREGRIGDVTGDGHADIVLIAHDRVLVYPAQ